MPSLGAPERRGRVSGYLGAFYLVAAGINIGLVVADRTIYRAFADQGLFSFVRSGWHDVVMDRPGVWIGLLGAGEIAIGLAFLARDPWPRAAYLAAAVFHVGLMLFGWGFWLWAVPALVGLLLAARHDGVLGGSRAVSPDRAGAAAPVPPRPGARSRPGRRGSASR